MQAAEKVAIIARRKEKQKKLTNCKERHKNEWKINPSSQCHRLLTSSSRWREWPEAAAAAGNCASGQHGSGWKKIK